jgi:hypothetical protein
MLFDDFVGVPPRAFEVERGRGEGNIATSDALGARAFKCDLHREHD